MKNKGIKKGDSSVTLETIETPMGRSSYQENSKTSCYCVTTLLSDAQYSHLYLLQFGTTKL